MRSLPTHRAAAAAVLLALPLSLAACSSSSSKSDPVKSSAKASSSATEKSAPSGSPSSDASADTDGKPTKAQVADGMAHYFVGKGVPRSLVGDVTSCVADKGYSQFSDATLRALKSGKVNELNPLDAGKLTKVTTECLASGKGSSLPSGIPGVG